MHSFDGLRLSDAGVVARYLYLRSHFHDRLLAQVEALLQDRYRVQPAQRGPGTLVALVRSGFVRPGEGEIWPVVFLTPVDITLALCLEISAARIASLGTMLKGPQRLRHRHWEDWWGWETTLAGVHANFFELSAAAQDEAMKSWYAEGLEWLANSGLLRRK
jgi:hypothetical protein